jgi:AraC family transcriptional regulator of adaptative response / methylphosphotriester-DNA alkyltransferase methyltransferase
MKNWDERWNAITRNEKSCDGLFYYAVRTTGIFCRPSCPSKLPSRENVLFFDTQEEALKQGFRPCKRCRPDIPGYMPMEEMVERTKVLIERYFREKERLHEEMGKLGISKNHLARIFYRCYGKTPLAYTNELRFHEAIMLLQTTNDSISSIAYASGFGSLSAFYSDFRKKSGLTPNEFRDKPESREVHHKA